MSAVALGQDAAEVRILTLSGSGNVSKDVTAWPMKLLISYRNISLQKDFRVSGNFMVALGHKKTVSY